MINDYETRARPAAFASFPAGCGHPFCNVSCGAVQLEEAERRIGRLESEKKELVEEKQVLDTKLSRGSEAIKKVSKEQEKLESKLQKLASDRDAAVAENKEAKAKITSLEVCLPVCM